jgi:sarcosine oxidase
MSARVFDVIVVGCGGMGSAAAFELARRGRRVLALEQFNLVHDRGSSHGHTRIIRQAYYEHPDYVPLVRRAYARWHDLEQLHGVPLLTSCDCLSIGRGDSELIQGVNASAIQHKLPIESLSPTELRERYPQFRFAEDFVGILERTAGFLYVEDCVRAHLLEAKRCGAVIRETEIVRSWNASGAGVQVSTDRGNYSAAKLVLTAGPWATSVLGASGVPLRVMRQVPLWFGTRDDSAYRRDRFPLYIADTPRGYFYGFPVLDGNGAKVAQHYGAPELNGPDEIARDLTANDEEPVRAFLRDYLPGVDGPVRRSAVCIYTLTPDRHFVIDLHPEQANVAIATGFSGHGFKFASVVGEILADLADTGHTQQPISLFRAGRFIANQG